MAKEKKKRADKYEEKLKIHGTFEDVIGVSVSEKVFVFTLESNKQINGYTKDELGANLPADIGKWAYLKQILVSYTNPLIGVDSKAILTGIKQKGYYISQPEIKIT